MAQDDGEPSPPPPRKGYSERDELENFLGWNATEPVGLAGATLTVSLGWCLFVELVRFFDPDPASPSIFGSFS